MLDRIKDIIYKIKDYDRLENDFSICLYYFTNGRLSKTNYEIRGLETLICDTIGEYEEEGYKHAVERAVEWLKKIDDGTKITDIDAFIEAFRKSME